MKTSFLSALTVLSAISLATGQVKTKEPRALIMTDGDSYPGFIVASSKVNLRYKELKNSTRYIDLPLDNVNVYFLEPPEFTEAMGLFRSRNYAEAHAKFELCAAVYQKVDEVDGNYSTLANFYKMECSRKLGNLAKLAEEIEVFVSDPLLHKEHLAQIEINNVFWDAVRTKAWRRLASIAEDPEWVNRKVSGGLRAQINYCAGLAHEGLNQPIKALNAYNGAFVADFSASEVLTRKAALACLRILKNHKEVKLAMKLFGTEDYSESSNGAFLLREGIALVKLWDKSLGGGTKLPKEYKVFLKYDKGKE